LNDIFKGITLKQHKFMRENLAKEKKVRERMERTEFNALDIIAKRGGYYKAHFGRFNNPPYLAQGAKGDWYE